MYLVKLFGKFLIVALGISFVIPSSGFAIPDVIRLEPDVKNELVLNNKKDLNNKSLVLQDKSSIEELIRMQKEEEVKDIEASLFKKLLANLPAENDAD